MKYHFFQGMQIQVIIVNFLKKVCDLLLLVLNSDIDKILLARGVTKNGLFHVFIKIPSTETTLLNFEIIFIFNFYLSAYSIFQIKMF